MAVYGRDPRVCRHGRREGGRRARRGGRAHGIRQSRAALRRRRGGVIPPAQTQPATCKRKRTAIAARFETIILLLILRVARHVIRLGSHGELIELWPEQRERRQRQDRRRQRAREEYRPIAGRDRHGLTEVLLRE